MNPLLLTSLRNTAAGRPIPRAHRRDLEKTRLILIHDDGTTTITPLGGKILAESAHS